MESKMQSPALFMRIVKYAFVLSAFLFIYVLTIIPAPTGESVSQPVEIAIAFAGLASVFSGFMLPRFLFGASERAPQNNSADARLKRWTMKGIMSLAYFEACILFGFVLNRLGARTWLVELLPGAGIAAELIWSPGTPPDAEDGKSAPG
jgi:hypothetical protein